MATKPKLEIVRTNFDTLVEVLGLIALVFSWFFVLYKYKHLPESIPTHFNFSGTPDGWGSKQTFLYIPIVPTLVFIGTSILNRFPHIFNYPVKITEINAEKQYTLAVRLLRVLKLAVSLVFILITMEIVHYSDHNAPLFGSLFVVIFGVIILVPLAFYLIQAMSDKD